jgi:hypothetical protein
MPNPSNKTYVMQVMTVTPDLDTNLLHKRTYVGTWQGHVINFKVCGKGRCTKHVMQVDQGMRAPVGTGARVRLQFTDAGKSVHVECLSAVDTPLASIAQNVAQMIVGSDVPNQDYSTPDAALECDDEHESNAVLNVIAPGSPVLLANDTIKGTVLSVMLSEGNAVTYKVAWWAGNTRNAEWLEAHEVREARDTQETRIGYRT